MALKNKSRAPKSVGKQRDFGKPLFMFMLHAMTLTRSKRNFVSKN